MKVSENLLIKYINNSRVQDEYIKLHDLKRILKNGIPNVLNSTGKHLSEALIFALTNPQNDDRLFIELQGQYMKIPGSNLGRTSWV